MEMCIRDRPVIMSTGMASPREIAESVAVFRSAGGRDLVLLHCVSGYPTPAEQTNLRRIHELANQFGCPVGLSDHTLGTDVAVASVAPVSYTHLVSAEFEYASNTNTRWLNSDQLKAVIE